jgi:hypothetical protein
MPDHKKEVTEIQHYWDKKPLLKKIYFSFYEKILNECDLNVPGHIVELGSGLGNLKMVIPNCICTDQFPGENVDQVENAYSLSFYDNTVSTLILFDVWHHLQYPGNALKEFRRVICPGGRIIIFDPDISLLSYIAYGLFHHETVGLFRKIEWSAPLNSNLSDTDYYASQSNANRIFLSKKYMNSLEGLTILKISRLTSLSYIASGGYRGRQLYADRLYPLMCKLDNALRFFPAIFSTRLMVVLTKGS